jgi:type I site-specific restriction endonuclease
MEIAAEKRILFLADRNILVDQTKKMIFSRSLRR